MKLALSACTAVAALAAGVAQAQTTLNGGGAVTPAPTYFSEFTQYTNANPDVLFSYGAAGDAAGQSGFLNNNIGRFKNLPAGTLVYGTIVGQQVDFGASDVPLAPRQLTDPATGSYANSATDGPLIQLPMLGVGIAFAFENSGLAGSLVLTDDQLCGILSRKLKDWTQVDPTATPGTIQVGYPAGSSGTTYILTNHLHAVCTAANSTFATLPVPVTSKFTDLFAKSQPPLSFTSAKTEPALQSFLLNTPQSFGYITPDFTAIAPRSATTSSLPVASVVNAANGKIYAPNVGNIKAGLTKPGTGSTHVTPPATLTDAMDPINWVPSVPVTKGGYSVVGYTTWDLSSCYANPNASQDMVNFLTVHFRNIAYQTLITNNGFVPLSNTTALPYVSSIVDTFLSNASGYNLNIGNKTLCAGLPGR